MAPESRPSTSGYPRRRKVIVITGSVLIVASVIMAVCLLAYYLSIGSNTLTVVSALGETGAEGGLNKGKVTA